MGGVQMAKKTTPPDGGAADSIKTTDISAITVNSAALEKIIGVSDRRIRQLAEENIIIRAAKGRYKLMDSITNYILTLKVQMEANNAESVDGEIDLEEEKAIHERVKRHISELKLQTMRGELHKSEDVERVMMDMLASVRAKLLSMPTKLAPILVSRSEIDFVRNTINREVMEALNELKDYNPKEFYSDEYVAVGDEESDEREEN
jgi:phage terminase Nu1 subunit (DNA packaging protein)